MFTTQLSGLLKRIGEKEEWAIEDAARLLAQAVIGDGQVYIKGFGEMAGVESEAISGAEPLPSAVRWTPGAAVTDADRVWIVSRFADDPQAVLLAEHFASAGVPVTAFASKREGAGVEAIADVFVDLHLVKGLLPDDTGGRFGFPASIAALYAYFLTKMAIDEMLEEY